MREITTHKVNGCNEAIKIDVLDEPGAGGANHEYRVNWPVKVSEGMAAGGLLSSHQNLLLEFQNGPIAEVGTNGITHEVLLAILIDRLQGFQNGPYVCEENKMALTHLRYALFHLQSRTKERLARGVEGTHKV